MRIVPDAGPERTVEHLQWWTMRVIEQNSCTSNGFPVPQRLSRILYVMVMFAGLVYFHSASAHHSFAQRVAGELQSIEIHDGTIELYKLLNPHSALIVRVDGEDSAGGDTADADTGDDDTAGGNTGDEDTTGADAGGVDTAGEDAEGDGSGDEDWLVELSSASTLSREGWTEEFLRAGDRVKIAILASRTPNRGRLRALLVHADSETVPSRLIVAYGIRGDTPIMRRLRERLPTCAGIDPRLERGECFTVAPEALRALEEDFPGRMGYILP